MPSFEVSPELIAALAGVVLSLGFSYIPRLSEKYAAMLPEVKRLIMLILLALVTVVIYAGICGSVFQADVSCDKAGIMRLVWMFVLALISNQSTYTITPQTMAVRKASDEARAVMYQRMGSYIGGE